MGTGAAAAVPASLRYTRHFLGQDTQAITFCQQSLNAFREYGDRYSAKILVALREHKAVLTIHY